MSALWNSSHTPPSLSFVPLSVMLRNQRPLKSALMRPKRHSSLLSPLPWSFWRSGFGSHTHTAPSTPSDKVLAHWVYPCGVSSSVGSCIWKTFEIFWWLVSWPGCYCSIYFSKFFFFFPFFSLFHFHEKQTSDESGASNKLQCRPAGSVIRGQGSKQL